MRETCSRSDYMILSPDAQRQLATDFLSLIEGEYADSEFGYDSFPKLDYDQMVFSSLFHELKESGKIESTGYLVFRLANRPV